MPGEYTCPNCNFTGKLDDFDTLAIEEGVWGNNCDLVVVPMRVEIRDRMTKCLQMSPKSV